MGFLRRLIDNVNDFMDDSATQEIDRSYREHQQRQKRSRRKRGRK